MKKVTFTDAICTNNYYSDLTVGKNYKIIKYYSANNAEYIQCRDDAGIISYFLTSRFTLVSRERKLKRVLKTNQ